ncbi:right-handed parallel beta-helix repeat-containing protein [Streptosporangium sp. NPDC002721]|uniref:right-handed parallel beta-helix repeat-containing protein n=1 Tax=Streptosporangium sp. NPDC002721 TaxID=3366188 RepID=UPI00369D5BB3
MRVERAALDGVPLSTPTPHRDDRGWPRLLAAVCVAGVTLLTACGPSPDVTPTSAPATTGNAVGRCPEHPTPACTGVPPGAKLSTPALNEDGAAYRVRTPGAVLDGVHITGDLLVHADDVVIRNSRIDGGVINADGDKTFRFTITDSTVGPAQGCQTLPGVGQDKYTATRVHVRGHSDGFRASGDDIVIKDSYIHLCSNPGDHSDGIQTYHTGKGLVFDHNTIDQRDAEDATAPIFLVDEQIVDASITDNLVMGGTYSIQLRNGRGKLIMRDNKLVDKSWIYGPVDSECGAIDWAGNSLVTIDQNYRITSTVGPLACEG